MVHENYYIDQLQYIDARLFNYQGSLLGRSRSLYRHYSIDSSLVHA